MTVLSGSIGRIMFQPYDVFYPATGTFIDFHKDFIATLERYFSNTKTLKINRNQSEFITLFVSFADGAADNGDNACAALDDYLSTLTGVTNA